MTEAEPDPTAAAFFDVDNTLMRGASIYHFARGLAARKMFAPATWSGSPGGRSAFRLRGAENSEHIDAARETALAFVAGHKVADIVRLGEEIYDETMADRIWEGTRELRPEPPGAPGSGSGWSPRRRSSWPRSSPSGSG